jgi:hypothetical protein
MYKQILNPFTKQISNIVERLSDKASIPFEPTSIDYQEYLDWLAAGNTPEPANE